MEIEHLQLQVPDVVIHLKGMGKHNNSLGRPIELEIFIIFYRHLFEFIVFDRYLSDFHRHLFVDICGFSMSIFQSSDYQQSNLS